MGAALVSVCGLTRRMLDEIRYLAVLDCAVVVHRWQRTGNLPVHHIDARENVDIGIRCLGEQPDQGGYPGGLKGQDIRMIARAFAVVDIYDDLTSGRL